MLLSAYLAVAGLGDVGYAFYNATETIIGARVTAGVRDAGAGFYSAVADRPLEAVSVRWSSAGTPAAVAREYFDSRVDAIALRTAGLSPGVVRVISPIAESGAIALTQGADYLAQDGLALQWSLAAGVDLTGATVSLRVAGLSFPIVVTGPRELAGELSRAQTATLPVRASLPFEVVAVLASGHVLPPLVAGEMAVEALA